MMNPDLLRDGRKPALRDGRKPALRAKITFPVRYFEPEEFKCPCCKKLGPWSGNPWGMDPLLLIFLDLLRASWGRPVRVNSGWRCPSHNKEVGGAANSRHLAGLAADIRPVERELISPFKILVKNLIKGLYDVWEPKKWEFIEYPTFIHIASPRE